ncbi:MAG: DUF2125 domain-containing protein [Rubrimonas sp.]|uniref:DUF2125 domain-containing protein n=1 Tax=Rubrimonas sp. TaxID=2036015 RepID=UPI002FDDCA28
MRRWAIGAAALALLAAGGVAAWTVGANRIDAAIEREIAALAASGLRVETATRGTTGFPFLWRYEAEGLSVADPAGLWRLDAPRARAEIAQGATGGALVRLTLPEGAALGVPGQGVSFAVDAEGLEVAPAEAAPLRAARLALTQTEGPGDLSATLRDVALRAARADPGARAAALDAASLVLSRDGATARLEEVSAAAEASGLAAPSLAAFQAAHGAASVSVTARRGQAETPEGAATFGPARMALRIDADGAALEAAAEDVAPRLGVAGAARIRSVEGGMRLPLRPGPEPGRYGMWLRADGAEGDAAFWEALDPDGALDRSAATLQTVISGDADLIGPAAGRPPRLTVSTVEIERFRAEALGAQIDATGLLRIRPGSETPDGEIALRLEGWEAALDDLGAAGLIGPDQMDFARAMAETYARPGAEPGALDSVIALRDGAVFANGVRVR